MSQNTGIRQIRRAIRIRRHRTENRKVYFLLFLWLSFSLFFPYTKFIRAIIWNKQNYDASWYRSVLCTLTIETETVKACGIGCNIQIQHSMDVEVMKQEKIKKSKKKQQESCYYYRGRSYNREPNLWKPGEPLTQKDRDMLSVLVRKYNQLGYVPSQKEVPNACVIKECFRILGKCGRGRRTADSLYAGAKPDTHEEI